MQRILALLSCFALTLLVIAPSLLTPGCGGPDTTAEPTRGTLVVGVTTDLRVGLDIDHMHVLMKAGGEVIRDQMLSTADPANKLKIPTEFAFSDRKDGEAVEITLEAFHPGSSTKPLVTRHAATEIIAGKTLLLRLEIDSRCALVPGSSAQECGQNQTCIAGICSDPEVDASTLEEYDPSWATTTTDICRPAGAGAPIVIVGLGQADYLPAMDGVVAQVEAGPQGGHHIWVAIRIKNLHQSGSITSVTGHAPDVPADVGPFNVIFTFDQDEGGYCKLYGLRFQLDADIDIEQLLGETLVVKVTVTDKEGNVGVGELTVKLSDDII